MGYRVVDAGVGVWLDKQTFTSSQVSRHVDELIDDVNGTISVALRRLGHSLKMAGGVTRAADLLEHVALVR
jgi:UDP:flavonoid glycosyltransferase YjiC (YdhE family)